MRKPIYSYINLRTIYPNKQGYSRLSLVFKDGILCDIRENDSYVDKTLIKKYPNIVLGLWYPIDVENVEFELWLNKAGEIKCP